MIYLFCSAGQILYKQDALDCTCYPNGHIFRFRYSEAYVDLKVWKSPKSYQGQKGLMVFLDTAGPEKAQYFDFFPVRMIEVVNAHKAGTAIYIDFKLEKFVNYGPKNSDESKDRWKKYFNNLRDKPWPIPAKSGRAYNEQGLFLLTTGDHDETPSFDTTETDPNQAWESVILRLDKTNDLSGSTFYSIIGFFGTRKKGAINEDEEYQIESRSNLFNTVYPLPTGKSVVLKILFSVPSYGKKPGQNDTRTLEISTAGDSIAGLSKSEIGVISKYNEENIILVCKRLFDTTLSSISIKQKKIEGVFAPTPFLLTELHVPKSITAWVLGGFTASAMLLTLDPCSIERLGSWACPDHALIIKTNASFFSLLFKAIAGGIALLTSYRVFRRLPLK